MHIYHHETRLLTNAYDYCDSAIRRRNNLATYILIRRFVVEAMTPRITLHLLIEHK